MPCHPAYFSLNYDELLLGENYTDEEFRQRYQTPTLRRPNPGMGSRQRTAEGGGCESKTGSAGAMARTDTDALGKPEGA